MGSRHSNPLIWTSPRSFLHFPFFYVFTLIHVHFSLWPLAAAGEQLLLALRGHLFRKLQSLKAMSIRFFSYIFFLFSLLLRGPSVSLGTFVLPALYGSQYYYHEYNIIIIIVSSKKIIPSRFSLCFTRPCQSSTRRELNPKTPFLQHCSRQSTICMGTFEKIIIECTTVS